MRSRTVLATFLSLPLSLSLFLSLFPPVFPVFPVSVSVSSLVSFSCPTCAFVALFMPPRLPRVCAAAPFAPLTFLLSLLLLLLLLPLLTVQLCLSPDRRFKCKRMASGRDPPVFPEGDALAVPVTSCHEMTRRREREKLHVSPLNPRGSPYPGSLLSPLSLEKTSFTTILLFFVFLLPCISFHHFPLHPQPPTTPQPHARFRLEEEGLPVPRSWAVLKPKADVATGSVHLRFGVAPAPLPSPPALLAAATASATEVRRGGETGGHILPVRD